MVKMANAPWIRCSDELPRNGRVVETKIHDHAGSRNEQELERHGPQWFFPNGKMYVYYNPTHWRSKPKRKRAPKAR